MKNCLVTKLKSVINNDNIPVFGESYFEFVCDDRIGQAGYGFFLETPHPITLKVENSYFTDSTGTENLGTEILYDGVSNCFIKPNFQVERVKVIITNKYISTKFLLTSDNSSAAGTAIDVKNDTLSWAVDITHISLLQGLYCTNLNPTVALARLTKLAKFRFENYNKPNDFLINDLAEIQIANGRNYTANPTLELNLSTYGYTKYFNGSSIVSIPTSTIFIVFKSGGYELHSDTADGTLLYDSLA